MRFFTDRPYQIDVVMLSAMTNCITNVINKDYSAILEIIAWQFRLLIIRAIVSLINSLNRLCNRGRAHCIQVNIHVIKSHFEKGKIKKLFPWYGEFTFY